MNRRSLLRSLAALSFAGSSFAAVSSLNAGPSESAGRENTIADLLPVSRGLCQDICRELSSSSFASTHASAADLLALIDQAELRLMESRPHAAAFWQACSDAFMRTAGQLDDVKSHRSGASLPVSEIQQTFLHAAMTLNQQTSAAIFSAFSRGGVIA